MKKCVIGVNPMLYVDEEEWDLYRRMWESFLRRHLIENASTNPYSDESDINVEKG